MQDHGRPVSQQRFAELAGYSKRTQERYETGKCEPRQAHLQRIVELTEKSRDFYFDSDDDEEAASMPADLLEGVRALKRLLALVDA